ncbi:chlorohydrolase [Streptococcus pneumoniae]|nr:chlorohydrolase [Streptococcus pneumoniae]
MKLTESAYCFEVADRTDVVSNHTYGKEEANVV